MHAGGPLEAPDNADVMSQLDWAVCSVLDGLSLGGYPPPPPAPAPTRPPAAPPALLDVAPADEGAGAYLLDLTACLDPDYARPGGAPGPRLLNMGAPFDPVVRPEGPRGAHFPDLDAAPGPDAAAPAACPPPAAMRALITAPPDAAPVPATGPPARPPRVAAHPPPLDAARTAADGPPSDAEAGDPRGCTDKQKLLFATKTINAHLSAHPDSHVLVALASGRFVKEYVWHLRHRCVPKARIQLLTEDPPGPDRPLPPGAGPGILLATITALVCPPPSRGHRRLLCLKLELQHKCAAIVVPTASQIG